MCSVTVLPNKDLTPLIFTAMFTAQGKIDEGAEFGAETCFYIYSRKALVVTHIKKYSCLDSEIQGLFNTCFLSKETGINKGDEMALCIGLPNIYKENIPQHSLEKLVIKENDKFSYPSVKLIKQKVDFENVVEGEVTILLNAITEVIMKSFPSAAFLS